MHFSNSFYTFYYVAADAFHTPRIVQDIITYHLSIVFAGATTRDFHFVLILDPLCSTASSCEGLDLTAHAFVSEASTKCFILIVFFFV